MEINEIVIKIRQWLKDSADSIANFSPRKWCLLGLNEAITKTGIDEHFKREEQNQKYVERYNANVALSKKKPYAYYQAEVHMIYSTHKSFVIRHKSRLQTYRDAAASKKYFTPAAISLGYNKFIEDKQAAEAQPQAQTLST